MKFRLFIASAAVAVTGLAALAGAAQAEELKFTFNDGRANLGDAQGVRIIDPTVPDPPAVLTVSYNPGTGAFTAPASGLAFPSKTLDNVDSPFGPLDVTATFTALGTISGNYEAGMGFVDVDVLNIKANILVKTGDGVNTLGECEIQPIPLPFQTTGQIVDQNETPGDPMDDITYAADPFVPAPGAVVATWADLPNSTVISEAIPGVVCTGVDGLVDGPGGLWLQAAAPTIGPDTCATNPAVCPAPPVNPPVTPITPITPVTPTTPAKKCKKGFKKKGKKCVKAKKKKK